MQKQSTQIVTELPVTYFFEKKSNERLLIFLHGYTDSASSFLRRAYDPLDFNLLAPNGPFPIPVRTDAGFKEAYSWYFEDHSIGRVLIPKELTIQILVSLIEKLGVKDHRKIIVGFSQGGFLAPRLSLALTKVDKIIGIGCDYREDLYEGVTAQVFGIHGDQDRIVDYDRAKRNFEARHFTGDFATIQNMDHKINDEAKYKLRDYILK